MSSPWLGPGGGVTDLADDVSPGLRLLVEPVIECNRGAGHGRGPTHYGGAERGRERGQSAAGGRGGSRRRRRAGQPRTLPGHLSIQLDDRRLPAGRRRGSGPPTVRRDHTP